MKTEPLQKRPAKYDERLNPIDIHIGERLKLSRHAADMTQEQLGKASGLTFQQIQKYEKGNSRISASRLYQLASFLGVPASYFFEDLPRAHPDGELHMSVLGVFSESLKSVAPKDKLLHRETIELIRTYYRVTDSKKRQKVYELIKSIADQS